MLTINSNCAILNIDEATELTKLVVCDYLK